MRTTRIYTPIYIALLFAAIGCDKNYDQPATGQNDIVMFAASLAGTANGADSGNTPQTKGVMLNTGTTDISLQSEITEFKVAAYDGTTRFIPATNATNGYETVTYSNSNSKWATGTTYFWPGSVNKTFYAYANMPNDLNTDGGPSISCTSTGQVLTGFSINTDYTAQQDILMGYYSGNGKGASAVERTAAIKFYHPLTAVRFKMGTATGVTINSLTISNIYSSGTLTQAENSFVWSNFGDATSITMSNTPLFVDGTSKLISNIEGGDNTFILIPQNLATKNVTVEITANTTEGNKTFTGTLSTGAWEAGTVYTYELRIYDEFKLQVVNVDDWKNNNSYNRSDYITRGAALMTDFVNKLAKNIEQAKYGTYDNNPNKEYIKTISFQTGMPLEDEAVIQRYDNEDDVIPGWLKWYEEGTDKKVVYREIIQEDQYTLYKRSEPIYSFCDADGNCIICTTADVIYFPISCESLFDGCTNLTSITGMTGGTTIPGDGFTLGTYLIDSLDKDSLGNVRTDHTTSMKKMFNNCKNLTSLNLPFNTSEVTDMFGMFQNCSSLTSLKVPFNTSKVTDMQDTFNNCSKLQTIDGIEKWSGEAVAGTNEMFRNCNKLGKLNLSGFITNNKLKKVNSMFEGCGKLTEINLSNLNTSGVTNMASMFENCYALESIVGINSWSGAAVTTTEKMFYECNKLEALDLSSFETNSCLKNVSEMFCHCEIVTEINLSSLNTSGVTNMTSMFENCYALKSIVGINSWSGAAVTTTASMFCECNALEALDLSRFGTTSNLTNVNKMFYECSSLKSLKVPFNTSKVTDMQYTFYNCKLLTTINGIENWNGESVTYASGMFYNCSKLSGKLDLSHFVTTNKLKLINDMFCGCGKVTEIDLSGLITSGVTLMSSMFEDCEKLETITGISNWDVKAVTSTSRMFLNCSGLTNKFDLSSFETTSRLTDVNHMFSGCGNVTEIDLSELDTSGITDMSYMFNNCSNLKSIVGTGNWSGDSVKTTKQMFYGCENLAKTEGGSPGTLDLSNFSTTNVTDMEGMFYNCKNISSITGINSWSGAAVTTTKQMFYGCAGLSTLDLSLFDTSDKLTTVEEMFRGCTNPDLVEINLNLLNTNGVTTFKGLFHSCYYVKKLTLGAEFKINSEATLTDMFKYLSYRNTGTACNIYCLPATQTTITSNATAVYLPLQSTLIWNDL